MNSKQKTPSPKPAQSFEELLEVYSQPSDGETTNKGQTVEGTVVFIDKDVVFVDIGEKLESQVSLSDFLDPPKRNETYLLVRKKRIEGGAWLLSKREADQRKGWESVKDAFKEGTPVFGRIIDRVEGKGYHVLVEGVQLFLPASQLGVKHTPVEKLKTEELAFKIVELNEKTKSGVASHKKFLDEINGEKWEELLKTVKVGDKVKGKVLKLANFGVFIDVNGVIGLLRQNDISYKKFAPFKHLFSVGSEVEALVMALDKDSNKLSLGVKQLAEDPWDWAKKELEKGTIIRGTVTSITSFGVFVELKEGLEGLIHISEIAWAKRPPNPKEIMSKGQEVEAEILDIDFEARRLSLGYKQLQPNPWDKLSSDIRVGAVLKGKITGIKNYGAFIEVENGIEGLVHVSDITWDEKEKNPTGLLKKGEVVEYKVLDINQDMQKISLGLKQLKEHPYEALRKKYPVGSLVDGKIKSIVPFGIFVEIEPGYEGLVHLSEIPDSKNIKLDEKYKIGEAVQASILKIDVNQKKISLSIKDYDKAVEREEMAKYIGQDNAPAKTSFGSLINNKT